MATPSTPAPTQSLLTGAPANPFAPPTESERFAKVLLAGTSKSGKSMTAFKIAQGLANGRRFAVRDSERGSARKYADLFPMDIEEPDSHEPASYLQSIANALWWDYPVWVGDSVSHEWAGQGGVLEMVDQLRIQGGKNDGFNPWQVATPKHNAFLAALVQSPIHIIATCRVKTEWAIEKDASGRTKIRKVGLAPIQRDQFDYEFDIMGDLDENHRLSIKSSRCPAFQEYANEKPGEAEATTLRQWLGPAREPLGTGFHTEPCGWPLGPELTWSEFVWGAPTRKPQAFPRATVGSQRWMWLLGERPKAEPARRRVLDRVVEVVRLLG